MTVRDATADETAKAGEDYEAASRTLTFAPWETTKTVAVKVKGVRTKEADETFTLNLSGATNAAILDRTGLGTILNGGWRVVPVGTHPPAHRPGQ